MIAVRQHAGLASFAEIGHRVPDHLLQKRARDIFDSFLKIVDGCRLLLAHVNHGVGPEEKNVVEVGPVGGPLDLSFARP